MSEPSVRQNGAAIRALRKKDRRGVTDFARHAGLHPQALRNIENGSRGASVDVILRLADILNVSVEAITRDGTDLSATDDEPRAKAT